MERTPPGPRSPRSPGPDALGLGVACLLTLTLPTLPAGAATPSRVTLEHHLDPAVEVHGRWAAVRLPVTNGVPAWNPTTLRFGPDGTAWAANYTGEVYRLEDSDGDGLEDTARLFCHVGADGLRHPITLLPGTDSILVGTSSEVRRYSITGRGDAGPSETVLRLPDSGFTYDWAFGLCGDPDGHIYLALPTDSYNPEPAPDPGRWRGALLRLDPAGGPPGVVATGLRFPYGVACDPSGAVWFTDNEGGGNAGEELNRVEPGGFYGHNPRKYPGAGPATPPVARLAGGRGPGGIAFNPPDNDFNGTGGDLFVAFWGPDFAWEEGSVSRVRIVRMPDGSVSTREIPVARRLPKAVDLAFSPGGDLYVASYGRGGFNNTPGDQPSGAFYRLVPAPWVEPAAVKPPRVATRRSGDPTRGAAVFQQAGCATCHAVDDASERFGPSLAGLGATFTESRVLEALRSPSASIRTGFEGYRVRTRDGQDLTGWVVTADADGFVLRVAPETDVTVARTNLLSREPMTASLMPAGLVDALSPGELEDLLAYLGVPEPAPEIPQTLGQRLISRLQKTGPRMRLRHKLAIGAVVLLSSAAGSILGVRFALRRRHPTRRA